MNLNMHIILDELSMLEPIAFIDESIEFPISSISYLDVKQGSFLADTLYIATVEAITSCRPKLNGINLISIGILDEYFVLRNKCNVIYLPDSVNIVEIVGMLFRIQKKYDEWNNAMLNAVITMKHMNSLFEAARELIHNPIMLLGPLNTMILTVGEISSESNDSIWTEMQSQGYISYDHPLYREIIKNSEENFREQNARVIRFPNHNHIYLAANIFKNGKRCGVIVIVEDQHPFTLGQITLIQHFKSILEQAVMSMPEFQILSSNLNSFVYQLLKHIYLKESIIINCLNAMGWKVFDEYYCIYCVSGINDHSNDVMLGFLVQELSRIFPLAMTLDYRNGVFVILRCTDLAFDKSQLRSKLTGIADKFNLAVGISSVFYDFKNLKRHYNECNLALKYGQDEIVKTSIYFFQDYIIRHLTRFVFVENGGNQFIHTKVDLLYKHDQKNGTELVKTLFSFLQFGQSKSLAAEKMHMHRNTLIYRLECIHKISGIECGDYNIHEDEIFHIMLSCKFLEYQNGF